MNLYKCVILVILCIILLYLLINCNNFNTIENFAGIDEQLNSVTIVKEEDKCCCSDTNTVPCKANSCCVYGLNKASVDSDLKANDDFVNRACKKIYCMPEKNCNCKNLKLLKCNTRDLGGEVMKHYNKKCNKRESSEEGVGEVEEEDEEEVEVMKKEVVQPVKKEEDVVIEPEGEQVQQAQQEQQEQAVQQQRVVQRPINSAMTSPLGGGIHINVYNSDNKPYKENGSRGNNRNNKEVVKVNEKILKIMENLGDIELPAAYTSDDSDISNFDVVAYDSENNSSTYTTEPPKEDDDIIEGSNIDQMKNDFLETSDDIPQKKFNFKDFLQSTMKPELENMTDACRNMQCSTMYNNQDCSGCPYCKYCDSNSKCIQKNSKCDDSGISDYTIDDFADENPDNDLT